MGWVVRGGQTVRVSDDIEMLIEEETTIDIEYVCDECGKVYKTEAGAERHMADKH